VFSEGVNVTHYPCFSNGFTAFGFASQEQEPKNQNKLWKSYALSTGVAPAHQQRGTRYVHQKTTNNNLLHPHD